jgi:hypothetical protein
VFVDDGADTGASDSSRQFAALGGAMAACLRTSPAFLSLVKLECRDAKLARGGTGKAESPCDADTAFQSSDANLAKLGAVATVDHADEHS